MEKKKPLVTLLVNDKGEIEGYKVIQQVYIDPDIIDDILNFSI